MSISSHRREFLLFLLASPFAARAFAQDAASASSAPPQKGERTVSRRRVLNNGCRHDTFASRMTGRP